MTTEPAHPAGPTIAVFGAGPKGLAVAAKARVLSELGRSMPTVCLIEPAGVAAHWTGEHGYTDGRRPLGTGPEKDVGFPYDSRPWGSDNPTVDRMMQRYSWQSFLVSRHHFGEWVDQGRPQPLHAAWAEYLRWVATQVAPRILPWAATTVDVANERWSIGLADGSHLLADGLVITGAGEPERRWVTGTPGGRVWDGRDAWRDLTALERLVAPDDRLAVIGSGETAAAILVALLERLGSRIEVDVITPSGIAYSRGESFEENRIYTDPESRYMHWIDLDARHRRDFTDRTDRGVFSLAAKRVLNGARNVFTVPGEVESVAEHPGHVVVRSKRGDVRSEARYAMVVVASAFDLMWFRRLLTPRTAAVLDAATAKAEAAFCDAPTIHDVIGRDLAVEGLEPRLHLPMLAGFRQGPGFPNLSCLGLLSDRILAAYA